MFLYPAITQTRVLTAPPVQSFDRQEHFKFAFHVAGEDDERSRFKHLLTPSIFM